MHYFYLSMSESHIAAIQIFHSQATSPSPDRCAEFYYKLSRGMGLAILANELL